MKRLKQGFWLRWAIIVIVLTSCSTQTALQRPPSAPDGNTSLKQVTLDQTKIVAGQTVYVPIYSQIYHYGSRNHAVNLSATLSIRNTNLDSPIVITVVDYYDTTGERIRQYLENPVELAPMASTDFFIGRDDVDGGLGANFLIEWVSSKTVYAPVVEAVMINTDASQGISFVSPGRILKQFGIESLEQARPAS